MDETSSNVKVDSIIFFIIHQYNFKPLVIVFNDFIRKKYSKKKFILIHFLLEAYLINNLYENTIVYKLIKNYVHKYPTHLLRLYMWK